MTLITQEFPPAPGGSNVALPAQEIDDTEARILQDLLVDYPGIARMRGPVRGVSGIAALTRKASGMAITLDPLGVDRYGVFNGDAANGFFSVYAPGFGSLTDLAWPHPLPTAPPATPYRIIDTKPALGGGNMLGVSSAYDANTPNQGIAFWRGGTKANFATTITSLSRGGTAVVGTGFTAAVSAGMWLFANTDDGYTSAFIGCVLSVNSNTSITLTAPSPYPVNAKAATFQSIRGIYPQITVGRITCDVTSTTVNGGATKFRSQGIDNSGNWNMYRQNDGTWIGKVSAVASDTSLTLAANASIALADEAYIAVKADADFSIVNTANVNKVGFLNASYTGRQWFANLGAQFAKTSRIWFSDLGNPEALDLTNDGNWIDVASTAMINEPIRALIPAYNSLAIIKENETFGLFGSSPSQFSVRKIHDDGTLCGMSVQAYGGGAIWAGRQGIHYYDGISVTNLTADKLGDVWKNSMNSFDPSKYRMWSMVARNHYFLFIENLQPTLAIVKGNTSTTPTSWCIAINMNTKAISWMTNLHFRGSITLPASTGRQVWYVVNDTTKGIVCDTDDLFDIEARDSFGCDGGPAGPDWFFESKKFDAGQALRLKRFKQLAIHYLSQGDGIAVDTVLGLNNIGTTLTSFFPASVFSWASLPPIMPHWSNVSAQYPTWSSLISAVFIPKRVRFLKRSQHFSFRLYARSTNVARARIGPYEIGYKLMRPGRV